MRLVLIKDVLPLTALLCVAQDSAIQATCLLTEAKKKELLSLGFKEFDQTLPNGGWRSLTSSHCSEEAREVIEAYIKLNKSKLEDWQLHVVTHHLGQQYAKLGYYGQAIDQFSRARDEGLNKEDNWNYLVD